MRRSTALIELSREHHSALVWSKKLSVIDSNNCDESAELWAELQLKMRSDLLEHFSEEEKIIEKLQLSAVSHPLIGRLYHDHAVLRNYLSQKEGRDVAAFAELLKQHVRFEERELFNWLESEFGDQYLNMIVNSGGGRETV